MTRNSRSLLSYLSCIKWQKLWSGVFLTPLNEVKSGKLSMEKKCSAVIIGVGPEQGLGAALSKYFAARGLQVFIAGRSEDKLHRLLIKSGKMAALPVH
jgi:hypothetical protein